MEKAIRKIIEKLILPQFPWVKDYELDIKEKVAHDFETNKPNKYTLYSVIYTPDFNLTDLSDKKELKRCESDTYTAMKMLGWDRKKFKLGPVVFRTQDGSFLMPANTEPNMYF